ncbi:MAG: hypothetical protein IPK19_40775 [Chloroflexi bacterium]|nr:hypothetical protein [Chloroflexota bacterium]
MDKMHTTNYFNTFITAAPDSPVECSVVPSMRGDSKPVHLLVYELLQANPYTYTGDDVLFMTYVHRLGLSTEEVEARRDELWHELFSKPQACLRSSALAKKYGWGFHFDDQGRIRLIPMDSEDYTALSSGTDGLSVVPAMRSKRG